MVELGDARWKLPKKKDENTFVGDNASEMSNNPALEQELASWYQSLIGMLRWMVKIGRIDIITEVSMMACQMAISKE